MKALKNHRESPDGKNKKRNGDEKMKVIQKD
ncbi:hypothetical protein BH780_gp051 [Bacillus phage Eldridge]|uniref:Uncharacterized protein n=1 Tax=Bacillus phage Eldridge TaxID=1776293 RepID=A0A0Y0A9V7_9CAUD|nr:hypothetical protein BH780_gp051 [Bacillus phage Eldridge]AMB18634.1 hypothetical protein Eldridge_054 [Bacillus phage Eldridge]